MLCASKENSEVHTQTSQATYLPLCFSDPEAKCKIQPISAGTVKAVFCGSKSRCRARHGVFPRQKQKGSGTHYQLFPSLGQWIKKKHSRQRRYKISTRTFLFGGIQNSITATGRRHLSPNFHISYIFFSFHDLIVTLHLVLYTTHVSAELTACKVTELSV